MKKKMTKKQLLAILRKCAKNDDPESAHSIADKAFLDYIADEKITEAFNSWDKWYARNLILPPF